jgi:exoribonuclease-2
MTPRHAFDRDELRRIAHDAMEERGLLPEFSSAVIRETEAIRTEAVAHGPEIADLRELPWASIDNDDSRDLDQLTVARDAGHDSVTILVAIADVDALVRKDCAIDGHAWTNTTSVYTPAGVFPMLPERLSTDLTSLGEGVERLAVVTEMSVSRDGEVLGSRIYRALVRNHAKLAYDGVGAWLEGPGQPPDKVLAVSGLAEQLRLQDDAAQALRRQRTARGALRLESLEVRAVFDDGELADLRPDRKNRAKELIEDFMIAANGVAARCLDEMKMPSLRRVLAVPKRWDRIVALAAESG